MYVIALLLKDGSIVSNVFVNIRDVNDKIEAYYGDFVKVVIQEVNV